MARSPSDKIKAANNTTQTTEMFMGNGNKLAATRCLQSSSSQLSLIKAVGFNETCFWESICNVYHI